MNGAANKCVSVTLHDYIDQAGTVTPGSRRYRQKQEFGARIHCHITQEEIGLILGACRETVYMKLADFERLGLMQRHGS